MNFIQAIKNAARAFNLSRGGDTRSRAVLTQLDGVSGTQISDGRIVGEDSNIKFEELESGIKEYRQMLRVDPIVRGLVNAWKLPIRRAVPTIEAASDAPEDEKIAEEVRSNLFENDNFTYGQWIQDVLRYLEFGFEFLEKQFEMIDGKWRWKAFKHRRPETISGWELDDNGGELDHIHQDAWDNNSKTFRTDIIIKKDKIFHIANEMEGENFQGQSVLRSAYRSYFIKDKMIRWQAIQAEKAAFAVLHGTLKNSSKKQEMIDFLSSYRIHEKGYVADSEGDFEIKTIGGKDLFGIDLQPWIDAHNKEMVEALSAGFLQQSKGDSAVGSMAKQGEDIDLHLLGLEAQANFIEDIMNGSSFGLRHIRQLVDLNHNNVVKYPKLKLEKISQDDVESYLRQLKLAKDSGAIDKFTNEDESSVREKLGAPEREMDEDEERGATPFEPVEEKEELELAEA